MNHRRTILSLISAALFGTLLLVPSAGAVPRAPANFVGVTPQETVKRIDTARMSRGNIKTMRVAVGWSWIQPTKNGSYNWDAMDETVRVAARERVRVMPFLYSVPTWISRKYTDMPLQNKNELDHWRKFLTAAVKRYGPDGAFWKLKANRQSKLPKLAIREWQIWNEANYFYFSTPVSPKKYARLVSASSNTIKKLDPGARIILSGLYATPKGPPSRARNATNFIRSFARYARKNSFDVVSLHAYAADASTFRNLVSGFRRTMVKSGLRSKPMYVTEMGWGSGSGNAFLEGSKAAQSTQLKKAITYLIQTRHQNKLRRVFWFTWKDARRSVETCDFCYSIGLFEPSGTKLVAKPAWRQLVKFTRGRP